MKNNDLINSILSKAQPAPSVPPEKKTPQDKGHVNAVVVAHKPPVKVVSRDLDVRTPPPKKDAPQVKSEPDPPEDLIGPLPLGYDKGFYFYLSRRTLQVHDIAANQHGSNTMLSMAPLSYWCGRFPGQKGTDWQAATDFLMSSCHKIGVYNPETVRGRGVAFDKGRVVLHLGSRLIVDGLPQNSLILDDSQYIYEKNRTLSIDLGEPLSDAEAYKVLEICQMFSWASSDMALLFAGWLVCAPICGGLPWRTHMWLTGQMQAGKAQPHSAKVLTPDGWRKMGDLKVGEYVKTPDNHFSRILKVHPQGKIDTFNVTFSDGRSTRVSADHLWKVRYQQEWRLRTTEQLIEILKKDNAAKHYLAIPVCDKMDLISSDGMRQKMPLHPYVLGVMLGDGHLGREFGKEHTGRISLTTYDDFIIEKCRRVLSGSLVTFYDTHRKFEFRMGDLNRYGRKTRALIKDLRILGTRSHTKFIPPEYLQSSIEDRIELLKGLMDTDGTINNGHLSFCTVSEKLAEDIIYLVRSLGGIARKSSKTPHYTHNGEKKVGKLAYMIGIRFPDQSIAFSLPRKLEKISKDYQYKDYFYLTVKNIEKDIPEECSCISIDHPDRLYVTDDFVVTHNSWVMANFVRPLIGPIGFYVQSKTTEAGIRQHLRIDSRPVIFDESETQNEGDRSKLQQVLDLARQASSDDGFQILKGTVTGKEMRFKIHSSFLFSSINFGATQSADESRIIQVGLVPMPPSQESAARFDTIRRMIIETLTPEFSGRLLSRTLKLLPTIRANVRTFARALSEVITSRQADTIGTIVAGVYSLYSSRELTIDEAKTFIKDKKWIHATALRTETEADHVKALSHLMEQVLRQSPSHEISIAEAIRVAENNEEDEINKLLARNGLRVKNGALHIARSHYIIDKMYVGTPWSRVWDRILLQNRGAIAGAVTTDFAGYKKKTVVIGLADLFG